jgi:hypothetical protein
MSARNKKTSRREALKLGLGAAGAVALGGCEAPTGLLDAGTDEGDDAGDAADYTDGGSAGDTDGGSAPTDGLSVSNRAPTAGDTVVVSWADAPDLTRFAWVALMREGPGSFASMYVYNDAVNSNCVFFHWLDGTTDDVFEPIASPPASPGPASGSIDYKLPDYLPDGQYFFRLWLATSDGYCPPGQHIDGPSMTVTNKAPTLTLDGTTLPTSKASGSALAVAWSGLSDPHVDDYFILYPKGRPMLAHDKDGNADSAPSNVSYQQNRWIWSYADNTHTDGLTVASRGQASGSFSFTVPAGLIEGDYVLYMVRERTAAGYTRRTICGHSAPITVTGVSYPDSYPLIDFTSNAPTLLALDPTSDAFGDSHPPSWMQMRPASLRFIGHRDYGSDGELDFVRLSGLNGHNIFELEWNYQGNPAVDFPEPQPELFSRYLVYLEDSFPDGLRPDGGGVKFPGGVAFVNPPTSGGGVCGNRTHIEFATAVEQEMRLTDYLQWLGVDDVGYGDSRHPGDYTADYVGGLQRKRWYCVELRYKMNTVTAGVADPNGGVSMWINNHLVAHTETGIDWTDQGWSTLTLRIIASIFHGGNDHTPAPQGYVRLAKLAWSTQRIGIPPEWVA